MNRSNTRWFRTAASSLLLGFLVTLAIGTAAAVEPRVPDGRLKFKANIGQTMVGIPPR